MEWNHIKCSVKARGGPKKRPKKKKERTGAANIKQLQT